MSTGVHAIAPGQRLGQYEIVTPLTSGGMAAVYLGRHTGPAGFSRHVAIKVVHPRFADDPQFIAMFLDEARLSSRIEHANVVRVEALGEDHGLYYLVMEYIRGAPLHLFVRRLAEKKRIVVPELVVHIMANVADGLHAAHETTDEHGRPLGIVHRDVTPQNVLLSYAGAIKLIDFGIAKAAGRSHHTAKGALKGKLRYMAPEQAAGKTVDRRTDVYALGIVLWEMLTYKKLFSARTDAELIYMVRDPKITPIRKIAPHVSERLEAVVMQALSVSPDERFQTALALRRALYESCPPARAIDAQELSVLVRGTMAGDIANEQRTLPPSVVSGPEVIQVADASREEAAMTKIVAAVAPLDDAESAVAPPTASPIAPPIVSPEAYVPQAPAPAGIAQPQQAFAQRPMAGASGAGWTPTPGLAATRAPIASEAPFAPPAAIAQPQSWGAPVQQQSIGAPVQQQGFGAPVQQQGFGAPVQQQGFGAPVQQPLGAAAPPSYAQAAAPRQDASGMPRASFTPPNASTRSEVMAGRPSQANPPVTAAAPPPRSSRVGLFLVIAIAVVLTIAIGGIGGWYALHQASRMMATP